MHQPANTFSARHESRGETTASSTGTLLTAAGSIDTKGSYVALGSPTSFAYEGFTVYLAANSIEQDYLIDISIDDGSGNNQILVPDLHFAAAKGVNEHNFSMFIPVHIAAGAQIDARVACGDASDTCRCLIVGHSANPGGFPGFSRAVALFTPGSSRGVAIDPGGSAHTKGSWVQMSASCPADVSAIFGVAGFNGDNSRAAAARMMLDIGIGSAGNEFVLVPNLYFGWGSTWDGANDVILQPIAASIPLGSRVAARAQCSITTASDRTTDLALYGLVR